jgi:hypothetical protein
MENDKSSRKNIPRSKQRQHQVERRPMKNALVLAMKAQNEDEASDLTFAAESRTIAKAHKGFVKDPDLPLAFAMSWMSARRTGKLGTFSSKGPKRTIDTLKRVMVH